MSCQLIRVNFRRKEVLSRSSLEDAAYDPDKCATFQAVMDRAKEIAIDAFQNNVNPKRIMVLIADPLNAYNYAAFDHGTVDMLAAMDALEYSAMRIDQALRDDLDI